MTQTLVMNHRKGRNRMKLIKTQMEAKWKGLLWGLVVMLIGISFMLGAFVYTH